MKNISCIIPAYNEEEDIERTLSVVSPLIGRGLFEVIVIDDASKDDTKLIIKSFPMVHFIEHTINQGKSKTVADGIKASKGDYIFLLDADLKFLNTKNITDLTNPINEEKSDIAISYRKNAWPLFPFKKIDYLSGERILPKVKIMPMIGEMEKIPSYGLEVFLNRIIIDNKMKISVVQWPNVINNFNQHKHGWFKGLKIIIGIWVNVLSTIPFYEMYIQNIKMIKLIVD